MQEATQFPLRFTCNRGGGSSNAISSLPLIVRSIKFVLNGLNKDVGDLKLLFFVGAIQRSVGLVTMIYYYLLLHYRVLILRTY